MRHEIAISGVAAAVSGVQADVSGVTAAFSNVAISQSRTEQAASMLIADADRGVSASVVVKSENSCMPY
jgi:hypothetical protein